MTSTSVPLKPVDIQLEFGSFGEMREALKIERSKNKSLGCIDGALDGLTVDSKHGKWMYLRDGDKPFMRAYAGIIDTEAYDLIEAGDVLRIEGKYHSTMPGNTDEYFLLTGIEDSD
tara:strand:+ start:78 stop:425 length:348 start_codon:yes stop_codon:yes gene_type:complete